MHDRIVLKGMRFFGRHGVLEREQLQRQPFVVDVVLYVDASTAALSDELEDTVDYGVVYHLVRSKVEGESFRLLETLAHDLAQTLLRSCPVHGVGVTVKKPRVPLPGTLDYAAVEVERWRPK